jgi:nitrous oxidase accessory protein NosD
MKGSISMPSEVFVGPGGFATIQEGVNAVDPFGTVVVAPGIYNENVTVSGKTVQLHGAQYGIDARDRIITPVPESVINGTVFLQSNKSVIDGFTVQNVVGNPGIFTSPSFSGYWIANNIVQNNTFGIYINSNGALYSQIKRNVIRNNTQPGAASGNGIYSDQGLSNLIVTENFLTGHDPQNAAGINFGAVTADSNIYIARNFLFQDSSIALANTTNVLISENCLIGIAASAIFFGGGSTLTDIEGNVIQDNNTGINVTTFFAASENTELRVKSNNIEGNINGLVVQLNSYNGMLDATNNYWGAPDGPSGIGPGSGDSIINNDLTTTILFEPFLTAPIENDPCPTIS